MKMSNYTPQRAQSKPWLDAADLAPLLDISERQARRVLEIWHAGRAWGKQRLRLETREELGYRCRGGRRLVASEEGLPLDLRVKHRINRSYPWAEAWRSLVPEHSLPLELLSDAL
jgi:hypothetical protein